MSILQQPYRGTTAFSPYRSGTASLLPDIIDRYLYTMVFIIATEFLSSTERLLRHSDLI